MSADVTLTKEEREIYRCPVNDASGEHYHAPAVEHIVAARLAEQREGIAQAIKARGILWGDPHRGFCIPDLANIARTYGGES